MTERIRIDQGGLGFGIWMTGWLFAIGFLDLGLWQGLLALFAWPYFLGVRVAEIVGM